MSGDWPEPTENQPGNDVLLDWLTDGGGAEATDGCWVEPDGSCEHGHPSWLRHLRLI